MERRRLPRLPDEQRRGDRWHREGRVRYEDYVEKPAEHKWHAKNLDMVGGTPWAPSPEGAAKEEAMPAVEITIQVEDPDIARTLAEDDGGRPSTAVHQGAGYREAQVHRWLQGVRCHTA